MANGNQLTGQGLSDYNKELETILGAEPADAPALLAAIDAVDAAGVLRSARLTQILNTRLQQVLSTGGQIDAVGITTGGTGYAIGNIIPIAGDTGEGGALIVTSVAAGVIDGVAIHNSGANYSGTPVVDTTGVGGADAALTATFSYDEETVIRAAIAAL